MDLKFLTVPDPIIGGTSNPPPDTSPVKVLILGGTGSIGSAIVPALLARGHEVVALGRSEESRARLARAGATPLPGDIRAPEAWSAILAEVDAVVHAAATFDEHMGAVDRHLLDVLLERLSARSRPASFVYTGGCWLYGPTGNLAADESTPLNPLEDFAWMAENLQRVLNAQFLRGLVIHPAMVYERDGGVFTRFASEAGGGGPLRVIASEGVRWPLVHRQDLAQLYVLVLEQGIPGAAYNGATIDGLAVGQIARAIARRHGIPEVPEIISEAQIVEELGSWARGLAIDQQMSGTKAREQLGWSPRHLDPLA